MTLFVRVHGTVGRINLPTYQLPVHGSYSYKPIV